MSVAKQIKANYYFINNERTDETGIELSSQLQSESTRSQAEVLQKRPLRDHSSKKRQRSNTKKDDQTAIKHLLRPIPCC